MYFMYHNVQPILYCVFHALDLEERKGCDPGSPTSFLRPPVQFSGATRLNP